MEAEKKVVSLETAKKLKEAWESVAGYSGLYEVSSLGRIRSPRCILKQKVSRHGRWCVTLSKKGVKKTYLVHRLVAIAFIPYVINKSCVNHIDGNPLNNHVANLEWCTYAENDLHARKNGLMGGERGNTTKLTKKEALEVRRRFANGESPTRIAKDYGIKRSNVYKIGDGKTWKYV